MRLVYLVSHPIQYQAPLLRIISEDPEIELLVLFESMESAGAYLDKGFGTEVEWDVPLTDGYSHRLVGSLADVIDSLSGADVLWVHGWSSLLKLRTLEIARRRNLPVLMRGENTIAAMPDGAGIRGVLKRMFLRWIFFRCAGFLCIGADNRDYYRAHGVEDGRLFFMPYAVDNDRFDAAAKRAAAERSRLREQLDLQPGRPVVLFAGKLQPRKNPAVLIDAMRAMDRNATRDPYLLVVGDGEQRHPLEQGAADDPWIRFLGFRNQSELPALYDLADVFVLASEREPWGLAVNEAMACGCAVVVSDECGCAADLVSESNGRVVPAGDRAALTNALSDILREPDRAAAMGAESRRRMESWGFRDDLAGLKTAIKAVVSSPHQS